MGAQKFDGGKAPLDLLDPGAMVDIARVLDYGAAKYGPYDWQAGIAWSRLYAAAMRHLLAFWGGENDDPETGIGHLAHAGCNVMFLLWHARHRADLDDRPRTPADEA